MPRFYSQRQDDSFDALWDYQQDEDQLSIYADIGEGRDEEDLRAWYSRDTGGILVKDESTSESWSYNGLQPRRDLELQRCFYNNGVLTIDFELDEKILE